MRHYTDEPEKKFSLVEYWGTQQGKYPGLFKIAMRMSSIPPSSAGAERNFSGSGLMLGHLRRRMGPTRIETKMFNHSNDEFIPDKRSNCPKLSRKEGERRVRARGTYSSSPAS